MTSKFHLRSLVFGFGQAAGSVPDAALTVCTLGQTAHHHWPSTGSTHFRLAALLQGSLQRPGVQEWVIQAVRSEILPLFCSIAFRHFREVWRQLTPQFSLDNVRSALYAMNHYPTTAFPFGSTGTVLGCLPPPWRCRPGEIKKRSYNGLGIPRFGELNESSSRLGTAVRIHQE